MREKMLIVLRQHGRQNAGESMRCKRSNHVPGLPALALRGAARPLVGRIVKRLSENVGQASSLTVHGASVPRVRGGRMPLEPADKMSAPHFSDRL